MVSLEGLNNLHPHMCRVKCCLECSFVHLSSLAWKSHTLHRPCITAVSMWCSVASDSHLSLTVFCVVFRLVLSGVGFISILFTLVGDGACIRGITTFIPTSPATNVGSCVDSIVCVVMLDVVISFSVDCWHSLSNFAAASSTPSPLLLSSQSSISLTSESNKSGLDGNIFSRSLYATLGAVCVDCWSSEGSGVDMTVDELCWVNSPEWLDVALLI